LHAAQHAVYDNLAARRLFCELQSPIPKKSQAQTIAPRSDRLQE